MQALILLRDNATAAACRIGLPDSGMFDADQMARLEKEAPVKASFERESLDSSGSLWIYFGDGRFGPIDPRTMSIEWADD